MNATTSYKPEDLERALSILERRASTKLLASIGNHEATGCPEFATFGHPVGGHIWEALSEKAQRELSVAGMDKKAFEAFLAWYDGMDVDSVTYEETIKLREEILLRRITEALLKKIPKNERERMYA